MIDLINIIDRLESLVETSKVVPVSGNVLVDKTKTLELLDQLRLAIPQEVKASEEVLSQKDLILNQALSDARRTKAKAEDDYRERVYSNEVTARAQQLADDTVTDAEERASRILAQCEREAKARMTEADAYALRSLRALEKQLNSISVSVRKGIDQLVQETAVSSGAYRSDNDLRVEEED